MKDYLIISEMFYSIQGEGKSLGTPAVFLRLAGCNLTCKGFSYKHPDTDEHLGCDTAHVWRKGERWSVEKIFQHWRQQAWLDKLQNGAHLIITGGEPLIQQAALINFITQLDQIVKPFIEIETNATLKFEPALAERINQINASPKLTHAGDSETKRVNNEALQQYSELANTCFKFVVNQPEDIDEIIQKYIQPLQLNAQQIWLMPEGGTKKAIESKALWLVEACKQHTFHYSPRLHISLWNEATGV